MCKNVFWENIVMKYSWKVSFLVFFHQFQWVPLENKSQGRMRVWSDEEKVQSSKKPPYRPEMMCKIVRASSFLWNFGLSSGDNKEYCPDDYVISRLKLRCFQKNHRDAGILKNALFRMLTSRSFFPGNWNQSEVC